MSSTSTYTLSFAELAGTGAVEALVGGSGVQIFLSLKAIGGSEKQRTHDATHFIFFHSMFHMSGYVLQKRSQSTLFRPLSAPQLKEKRAPTELPS